MLKTMRFLMKISNFKTIFFNAPLFHIHVYVYSICEKRALRNYLAVIYLDIFSLTGQPCIQDYIYICMNHPNFHRLHSDIFLDSWHIHSYLKDIYIYIMIMGHYCLFQQYFTYIVTVIFNIV